MSRLLAGIVLLPFIVGLSPALNAGSPKRLSHDDALAVFILNCAYYGIWPAAIDPQQTRQLRIGLVETGLESALEKYSQQAMASWFQGGNLALVAGNDPETMEHCHIVFISNPEREAPFIEYFKGKPVLLLSETHNFINQGGTIRVWIERERLQFEINLDSLRADNIEMKSAFKQKAVAFFSAGKREGNAK
ncbi:MAG: YfiR family protein [Verrucomicrobiota bacterium]|nr:YfiR family protein [Verrucomicrobiota bacterium]